jgi:hypothetical protein
MKARVQAHSCDRKRALLACRQSAVALLAGGSLRAWPLHHEQLQVTASWSFWLGCSRTFCIRMSCSATGPSTQSA